MGFDIQIAHSVTEIGQEAWDRFSAERRLSSYRWYCFGEVVLEDSPSTYIFLSQGGEPLARATFWLKRQDWLPITSGLLRAGAEGLLRRRPMFACAAPLISLSGLVLPQGPYRGPALDLLASMALDLAKEHRASYSLFSYTQPEEAASAGWPGSYSSLSYADEETILEIGWPDFDSYLRSLAHSTRRNYKLHCKKADEMKVSLSLSAELDPAEAIPLIHAVDTFHHVGHRPWTRRMVEHLSMVDSTWITARVDGRLVGCCAVIGDRGIQTATLLGLDYTVPDNIYVYYQVIYGAIRAAIESGASLLYGGGGAYELKRRLGFHTLPDDCLMIAPTSKFFALIMGFGKQFFGGNPAAASSTGQEAPDKAASKP